MISGQLFSPLLGKWLPSVVVATIEEARQVERMRAAQIPACQFNTRWVKGGRVVEV